MFCLAFGDDELSVPVMRRVLGDTLRGLGVEEDSVYDVLLAATEACVVAGGAGYAVVTSLSGTRCRVEVTGSGRAAYARRQSLTVARGCMDDVTLRRRPGRDTVVILRKHISWSWDAPLRRVAAASRLS